MALLSMCEEMGLKFLNTAEALKDSTGYGNADYYQSGDIHLKTSGLKVLLNYLRTHAYETEDRRPDTNNIPSRAEYVPDPSSAVASSSSEVTSSSSEVQEDTTQYQASYRVDKTGGGTLSAGNDNGKTTLTYGVGASQSVSVTAVPASGHVFVKWSDGRLGADQQQRQGCSGRQLHLPREDQRQASGGRFHPLVCQRCGGCFCRRPDQRDGAHYG